MEMVVRLVALVQNGEGALGDGEEKSAIPEDLYLNFRNLLRKAEIQAEVDKMLVAGREEPISGHRWGWITCKSIKYCQVSKHY